MAENIAVVVNWYGPYKGSSPSEILKNARDDARIAYTSGLYAAIGHPLGVGRGPRTVLYMGVAHSLSTRLNNSHHKLSTFTFTSLWLGEVSVPGIPGRRQKKINPHLDVVEWASAYFLKLPFNERKIVKPPFKSCVVVNRWWGTDYQTEVKRPAARWADIIEYDSYRGKANLIWLGTHGRIVSMTL